MLRPCTGGFKRSSTIILVEGNSRWIASLHFAALRSLVGHPPLLRICITCEGAFIIRRCAKMFHIL